MSKKIIYILIFIFLIVAGIFAATEITENDKTKPVIADSLNNISKNNEKNEVKENNTIKIEVNEAINDVEGTDIKPENTDITPEEKAKKIVRDNWGEDDSVYYSYDGMDATGRYVICVREIETTKALYRYYVDVETGAFEIE